MLNEDGSVSVAKIPNIIYYYTDDTIYKDYNVYQSLGSTDIPNRNNLKKVVIKKGVENLSNGVFSQIKTLEEAEIEGVEGMNYAFTRCSNLKKVTLPTNNFSMENHCFEECTSLSMVNSDEEGHLILNDNAEIKYNSVFGGCLALTDIYCDSEIIAEYTFSGCSQVTSITLGNNVTEIKEFGINLYNSTPISFDTNQVKILGEDALGYTSFKQLILNENIESFYKYICNSTYYLDSDKCQLIIKSPYILSGSYEPMGFMQYSNLYDKVKELIVECDTITSIAPRFCYNMYKATKVTLPENITEINQEAFSNCYALQTIGGKGSGANLEIPSGTSVLQPMVFKNCTGLTSVEIPNNITSVSNSVFGGCKNLISIRFADSVKTIGDTVFSGCTELESVDMGNGVEIIGGGVFVSCPNFSSIIISNNIKTLQGGTFGGCINLQEIYCDSVNEPCEASDGAFSAISSNGILHVKKGGSVETYPTWMNIRGNLGSSNYNWVIVDDIE